MKPLGWNGVSMTNDLYELDPGKFIFLHSNVGLNWNRYNDLDKTGYYRQCS